MAGGGQDDVKYDYCILCHNPWKEWRYWRSNVCDWLLILLCSANRCHSFKSLPVFNNNIWNFSDDSFKISVLKIHAHLLTIVFGSLQKQMLNSSMVPCLTLSCNIFKLRNSCFKYRIHCKPVGWIFCVWISTMILEALHRLLNEDQSQVDANLTCLLYTSPSPRD